MSAEPPIYLDYHATTPCDPRVVERMLPAFEADFGNASSRQHVFGQRARELVEDARLQVAQLLACEPAEIIFTSGATESINLAIKGLLSKITGKIARSDRDPDRPHVITVRTEHKAVLDACHSLEQGGVTVTYLGVDADGFVRLEDIEAAMTSNTVLVSIMYANNEIGTLQAVQEIGALCKKHEIVFHCDVAQALPYLRCSVEDLQVDLLSLSAHKIYGPKGIGALYVRRRRPHVRLRALLDGGGHERGLRSGTLNVPGIVGMGEACALVASSRDEDARHTRTLRDRLHQRLLAEFPGLHVNGSMDRRLPNNLNVSLPGIDSERLLAVLDGVAISSGSACSSASWDDSYVIKSLGSACSDETSAALDAERAERARGALRFGIGRFSLAEDIDLAVDRLVIAARRNTESAVDSGPGACDPSDCTPPPGALSDGLAAGSSYPS
jgi:cysteine desulfurase